MGGIFGGEGFFQGEAEGESDSFAVGRVGAVAVADVALLDEFIDFNKSDSSEFSITPSPYPAIDLVKEMYFMFTDYAASRKIRYTFNASKDECSLHLTTVS